MAETCGRILADGGAMSSQSRVRSGRNVAWSGRARARGRVRFGPGRIPAAAEPRIGSSVDSTGSPIFDGGQGGFAPVGR